MSRTRLEEVLARRKVNKNTTNQSVAVSSSSTARSNKSSSSQAAPVAQQAPVAKAPKVSKAAEKAEREAREAREREEQERQARELAAALEQENEHFDDSQSMTTESDHADHHAEDDHHDSENESMIEEAPAPVKRGRGRPQSAASGEKKAPKAPKDEVVAPASHYEFLPKQSLIRLLRSSEVTSLNADVIDVSKEVLENIIQDAIKHISNSIIRSDDIAQLINYHFEQGEESLPMDVTVPPTAFDRFLRSICDAHKVAYKRDAAYLFHLYCEAYLIKMVKAADMVAVSAKRARVQGSDLTIAYHIYNM